MLQNKSIAIPAIRDIVFLLTLMQSNSSTILECIANLLVKNQELTYKDTDLSIELLHQ